MNNFELADLLAERITDLLHEEGYPNVQISAIPPTSSQDTQFFTIGMTIGVPKEKLYSPDEKELHATFESLVEGL